MLGMLIVATAISTEIALTLINPSAPPPVEATGTALLAVPKIPPQPVSAAGQKRLLRSRTFMLGRKHG
jgi:hypothetical protein